MSPARQALPLPRRGDVWLADLAGDKVRPIVIMTRTVIIRHLHSVIAAPVTSTVRDIPSEVLLGMAEGLLHESVANLDNLQLVPRAWLLRKIGVVGERKLIDICDALSHATGC